MYCRNSITLDLIRGLDAVILIIGVFVFQLSLVTQLFLFFVQLFCYEAVLLVGFSV